MNSKYGLIVDKWAEMDFINFVNAQIPTISRQIIEKNRINVDVEKEKACTMTLINKLNMEANIYRFNSAAMKNFSENKQVNKLDPLNQ